MNYTRHTLVGICLILLILVVSACKQRDNNTQLKDVVTIGPGDNTALFYTEVVEGTDQFVIEICEGFIEINKRHDCVQTTKKRFFDRQELRQQLLQSFIYLDNSKLIPKNRQIAERYSAGFTQPESEGQKQGVLAQLKTLVEIELPAAEKQLQMLNKKLKFFGNSKYDGTWEAQDLAGVQEEIKAVHQAKAKLEQAHLHLTASSQSAQEFNEAKVYIEAEVDQLLDLIKAQGVDMGRTFLSTQHGGWIFYNAAYRTAFPLTSIEGFLESLTATQLADLIVPSSETAHGSFSKSPFLEKFFSFDREHATADLKIGSCILHVDWWGKSYTVVRFGSESFDGPYHSFKAGAERFITKDWVKETIRAHHQAIMAYFFSGSKCH